MRKRNKSGLKVRKPVSVLNRPLKADFGGLFKALANALAHSLTLKWEELLPDLAAASAALGLREEPAQLAWLLIRRSLAQAVFEIVGQTPQITPSIGALEQNQSLTDQIDNELASLDTEITRDFFQHPEKLEIVSVLRERITGWLLALGINSASGKRCAETRAGLRLQFAPRVAHAS
jgi:NACHT N-terminal Helical domain 3